MTRVAGEDPQETTASGPVLLPRVGVFVTLEGGDGTGKSTQVAALADWLRPRVPELIVTREPGGTAGGDEIRALLVSGDRDRWDPRAEALLHAAARRAHVARLLRPALARGAWVICDRFFDSTTAYQGHGLGLDLADLAWLRAFVCEDLIPDLTVILDAPPDLALARARGRQSSIRNPGNPGDDMRDHSIPDPQHRPVGEGRGGEGGAANRATTPRHPNDGWGNGMGGGGNAAPALPAGSPHRPTTSSRSAGGEDRYERMATSVHERIRRGFLEIARTEPARCRVIDASQPIPVVAAAIRAAVAPLLAADANTDPARPS